MPKRIPKEIAQAIADHEAVDFEQLLTLVTFDGHYDTADFT